MEIDEIESVFDLVARESKMAENSERDRWERFIRFICGEPMKMDEDISPESFGFELDSYNERDRVVCFKRNKLLLVVSESLETGLSFCETENLTASGDR